MRIEVLRRLQEQNDAEADEVRRRLDQHGVVLLNIMGSPGCGKTTLLEATLSVLCAGQTAPRCAVLEGDPETVQDAKRIADLNIPVAQLLTEGGCHLKPGLVHSALQRFDLANLDCVFVENVGNLVCPANFDIGEHARVVVLSVPEGDDKVSKYPYMFRRAGAVVLSKLDLLPACPFDLTRARTDILAVNPEAEVFEISAIENLRRSTGIENGRKEATHFEAWIDWVRATTRARRPD